MKSNMKSPGKISRLLPRLPTAHLPSEIQNFAANQINQCAKKSMLWPMKLAGAPLPVVPVVPWHHYQFRYPLKKSWHIKIQSYQL